MLVAPLTLAALVVLFIAIASESQKDRVQARCLQLAADVLTQRESQLNSLWEKAKPIKSGYWGGDYKLEITTAWIYELHVGSECYKLMEQQTESRYRASPAEIISKLRQDATALNATPLQFYGVDLPDRATINFFGTVISIGLMTFTQILQIALAPLLILWLGSLYNTRYRETRLIGTADSGDFAAFDASLLDQICPDYPGNDLQYGCQQFGMRR